MTATVRIFKNRWFAKFAIREEISDSSLVDSVRRAESGVINADLGGGVIKQRIARSGAGKSSGYRTLIFYRARDRAIFVYGFAKNVKANLDPAELKAFKKAAKIVLELSAQRLEVEVRAGQLMEVV